MEFDKKLIETLKKQFDEIINMEEKEHIEFWYARNLQKNESVLLRTLKHKQMLLSLLESSICNYFID